MTLQRVWVDTDPAITAGNGEVDDAFAPIQALCSPELQIASVSAVYGITDIDHTFSMAREIVPRSSRLPDAFARHLWPTRMSYDGYRPLFAANPSFDGPIVTYLREVDHDRSHANLMLRLLSG